MNNLYKKLEFIGFFFVSIAGTLLHFAYEFSGNNTIVGIFTPINESTFEHLKLIFYPYIIFAAFEYFLLNKHNYQQLSEFICAKTYGVISGMSAIIIIFYTYSGVIGQFYDIVNILLFFISVLIAFYLSYKLTTGSNICFLVSKKEDSYICCKNPTLCITIILLLIALFIVFTVVPPELGIFESPV